MTSITKVRALARLLVLTLMVAGVQGMTAAQNTLPAFVTWTETHERFAFDVPFGWTVDAYIFDLLGQDAPYVYVYEPEDRAMLVAGVPSATLYLDSADYAQGEQVTLDGYPVTVRSFQTPAQFLNSYLRTEVLAERCETIFVVRVTDAEPTGEGSVAADMQVECHNASAMTHGSFTLQMMRAEVDGEGLMWMPTDFYGYLSEPAYEALAGAAMEQMIASFVVNAQAAAVEQTTVSATNAATPVEPSQSSSYDPDAFLAAQQALYQQQQTAAMISNMLQMQHQTSMSIINNIGSGSTTYEYQWVWTP